MASPNTPIDFGTNKELTVNIILSFIAQLLDYDIGTGTSQDIPSDVVEGFIREGFEKIVNADVRWPWYQATFTWTASPTGGIAGTDGRSYVAGFTQTNPNVVSGKTFSDMQTIISCVNQTDAGNRLIYIDQFTAEGIWVGDNDIAGIPAYWSTWGNCINLWPKPDSNYSMELRGYRQPLYTWLTDPNIQIDIDYKFHMPLMNYVLARIFQFQEDPEMASIYMNNYEQGVAIVRGNITAPNSNQPMILSGGLQLWPYSYYNWMANMAIRAVATGEWT